jgi:hypothetical protein
MRTVPNAAEFNQTANKSNLPSFCQRREAAVVSSLRIDKTSEYFFRPFPDGDRITYSDGTGNYINDFSTGKEIAIQGIQDAFPTPDGRGILIAEGQTGLRVYEVKDPTKLIKTDTKMKGYYQSVGVMEDSGHEKKYRIMIDQWGAGFFFKDYGERELFGQADITSTDPKPLCGNQKFLSLPMISKNGRMLSAFSAETHQTIIFAIDRQSGNCTPVQKLGVNTGKVDFSHDGKFITYAQVALQAYMPNKLNSRWMEYPFKSMVANVYERDLASGKTRQLTHYTENSALYPAYDKNGKIITRKYLEHGTEFIKLDPKKNIPWSESSDVSEVTKCSQLSKPFLQAYALASLFLKYCTEQVQNWNLEGTILLAQDLDRQQCFRMATMWPDVFGPNKDLSFLRINSLQGKADESHFKNMTQDELFAACGNK